MSSRGSFAKNNHITTNEYVAVNETTTGAKILEGKENIHSLPDFAHTPNSIYVKMKKDGKTLHELRVYGSNCLPIIEIAYHPEPNINNGDRQTNIVHFHMYDGLIRGDAVKMSDHPEIKEKYAIYLKEFDLYDKC